MPVLKSLAVESCQSRAESALIYSGESSKFVSPDKKLRDAQDDVTELIDLFDAHFWGWKGYRIWTPKAILPQHVDVCVILPVFFSFMVSGELLKQGAFRASCRNPKAGLPHAPTRGFDAPVFSHAC